MFIGVFAWYTFRMEVITKVICSYLRITKKDLYVEFEPHTGAMSGNGQFLCKVVMILLIQGFGKWFNLRINTN